MRTTPAAPADKGPDFDLELAKFSPRQMDAVKLLDHAQAGFAISENGYSWFTDRLSVSPVSGIAVFL
jgi:hypothetical protein